MINTDHKKIHKKLKKKGWDKHYISKTMTILKKRRPDHDNQNKFM